MCWRRILASPAELGSWCAALCIGLVFRGLLHESGEPLSGESEHAGDGADRPAFGDGEPDSGDACFAAGLFELCDGGGHASSHAGNVTHACQFARVSPALVVAPRPSEHRVQGPQIVSELYAGLFEFLQGTDELLLPGSRFRFRERPVVFRHVLHCRDTGMPRDRVSLPADKKPAFDPEAQHGLRNGC